MINKRRELGLIILSLLLPLVFLVGCDEAEKTVARLETKTTLSEKTMAPIPTSGQTSKPWKDGLNTAEVLAELQSLGIHFAEVASGWGPYSRPVARGFFQQRPCCGGCQKDDYYHPGGTPNLVHPDAFRKRVRVRD